MKRESKKEVEKTYLLDTSAVIAYLADEDGADKVTDILNLSLHKRIPLFLSFMGLMELEYNYLRKGSPDVAKDVLLKLKALPLEISFENDLSFIHRVAELKVKSNLSVADAWIAALASKLGATLVHKDPEFESLSNTINLLPLPYK